MAETQKYRRQRWEHMYANLEYETMEEFEKGLDCLNKLAAKYDCHDLSLDKTKSDAFKVAVLIYEAAKRRPKLYSLLKMAILPDNDGTKEPLVIVSIDLLAMVFAAEVSMQATDFYTLKYKSRNKTRVVEISTTSVPVFKLHSLESNISSEELGDKLLDAFIP